MQCDCESSKCKHAPGACEEIPLAKVSAFGIKYNSCLLCAVQNCDVLEHVDQHSKGYEQGYNPLTGDVLLVFTPTDIQDTISHYDNTDQTAARKSVTIEDAKRIAEDRGSKIVDGFLNNDWQYILWLCIEDDIQEYPRLPIDDFGRVIEAEAGTNGSIGK